ncbi:MAG: glycosyltransferase [Candidatus Binatia bacterium]
MTTYSIIVPAYNEEQLLPATLRALREEMQRMEAAGEVIVVDNNSTDRTSAIAAESGARVVFEPLNQISRARNAGARAARGRYLMFVDADTVPSNGLLLRVLRNLEHGNCCGGGARVSFADVAPGFGRTLGEWVVKVTHGFGVAGACFLYCSREAFDAIGGFSEKVYAGEEIWISRALRTWGRSRGQRFEIIDEYAALTSARKLAHPWKVLFALLFFSLFPIASRWRTFCFLWYGRR